jgi:putative FmdB family regulatory protein
MPTYQYQCAKGHQFELFQRISDKPRAKCPTCGSRARRVITGGAGLIFKGSGFYITDYGKDGKGPRKAPEAAEQPAGTEKPAAKEQSGTPQPPPTEKKASKRAEKAKE